VAPESRDPRWLAAQIIAMAAAAILQVVVREFLPTDG